MWSSTISAFHLCLHSSSSTTSVRLAGNATYKYSHYIMSHFRRSIFSEVTKKRRSAKEQNYTETLYREGKINSASSEYKTYSSCSTQVTTQTFATPTPVNRASNSSCRRGSRLWSSSIMAAETRGQIKEDIAGAGSVVIVKWESCLTVSSDMMSHGCI